MKLSNFEKMDPNLLVGLVNTALRNDYDDLRDLAKSQGIEASALEERLAQIGYVYVPEQNQFRPGPK